MPIEAFCGIPTASLHFLNVARREGSPLLMSANAFWRNGRFRGYEILWDIEVPFALDSSGFVAMRRYGGYRWSIFDYVELATTLRPLWWAAMDYCCEPEISSNQQQVTQRVENTIYSLAKTIATVAAWNRELPGWPATPPIPVIQGWKPSDYRYCIAKMQDCLFGDPAYAEAMGHDGWPSLVGVGSVCRRQLSGESGLMRVIDTLEGNLPANVHFHLFGVKSTALSKLKDRPRISSVDSMAWNSGARWQAYKTHQAKGKAFLSAKMEQWVISQKRRTIQSPQLSLL
jgi:hypothetical protein